jgi:hypothetical protein
MAVAATETTWVDTMLTSMVTAWVITPVVTDSAVDAVTPELQLAVVISLA